MPAPSSSRPPSALLRRATLALCLSAMGAPAVAHAQQEAPAPAAPPVAEEELVLRYPPSSSRWKIIVAGAATFAFGYGASAAFGGIWSDVPGKDWLFVPVAGPWAAVAQSGCAADEETSPGQGDCEGIMAVRGILFVVDGLVQLGGLGILGEGIFMTTESEAPAAPKKAFIVPTPIVTEHAFGVGVSGTF
ncbi:MAG: hypothetical protein JNL21_40185 [Myxococcales bacterium]|nr:hypothetical protein [Myxococcales bacterium]